jgi:PTH1 family peptidyl-tRNA hydrolase
MRCCLARKQKKQTEQAMTGQPQATKIIVGLGNPGREYAKNRHNVGFQIVDLLARRHGLTFDKRQGKARLARGTIGEQRVILVKPRTFMNECGPPVVRLAHYYRVEPPHMLVIFDDLDLPVGRIRLRPHGGTGGHRGMASIIKQLGSNEFPRLRVGIDRPPGRMDPAAYVLQDFSAAQEELMAEVRERSADAVEHWLREGPGPTMNEFNSPPG